MGGFAARESVDLAACFGVRLKAVQNFPGDPT
jgi:hypothetical protein